jgi:aminoglycoside/choline kinase family phosphotransferase
VKDTLKLSTQNAARLDKEFHKLARKVDTFTKTVIHRDFQCQNIMVNKGEIPKILDYQGARIGPPAYDVVSILWDPYYRLEDEMRTKLLDYYIHKVTSQELSLSTVKRTVILKEKDMRDALLPCRLQRHMQALGAYGFLSTVKGKKYFTKHIPEGLRLIREDAALAKEEYPELYRLITTIP